MRGSNKRPLIYLPMFITGCLAIGFLGSLATSSSLQVWYAGLRKPPLNPPNWVFAPVWSALYVLIGIVGWRLWTSTSPDKDRLKKLFLLQLALNALWSFLFFGWRNPLAGLVDILILWSTLLVLTYGAYRKDRISGLLLLPYLSWVSFATYLNTALWWLNRR